MDYFWQFVDTRVKLNFLNSFSSNKKTNYNEIPINIYLIYTYLCSLYEKILYQQNVSETKCLMKHWSVL